MRPVTSIWGAHAQRFCECRASARLVAVFARSFHLEADGDFVCIGDASIGRGPLNAIVDLAGWTWASRHLPAVGAEARVGDGTIECGRVTLVTAAASSWLPPPWPHHAEWEALSVALADFDRLACEEAPVDGIARVALLAPANLPASASARLARPRIARLRKWVAARLARPMREPAPFDLVGFGSGLTPSGDDLLCGALVALHAIGRADAARELYAAISGAARLATSPLSAAFLRAAAEGQSSEPLHETIIALLKNQSAARPLEAVARIGHTSGWDALAGAVLVLRACAAMTGQASRVVGRPILS